MEISNQSGDLTSASKDTAVENPLVEETLNVVFQSPSPKSASLKPSTSITKTLPSTSSAKVTLTDVLPVEQIAEEMENLILQQLEEEERAKELSSKVRINVFQYLNKEFQLSPVNDFIFKLLQKFIKHLFLLTTSINMVYFYCKLYIIF